MKTSKLIAPWVLFGIEEVAYAISSESILSLNQIPEITRLPNTPPQIRGVINFREKMIQLLDTRILLNIKSIEQEIAEFSDIMDQRFKEHTDWVTTLEKCVFEDTDFTLTTDPHKCAFGKWYDDYKLQNANIMFLSTFARFDKPHKAIHQIGITAKELIASGKKEDAIALIKSTKDNELKQMMHLFEALKEAHSENMRETILILNDKNQYVGLAVDKIIAIENLTEIDEEFIKDSLTDTEYLSGVAKRKDDSVVFLLNDEYILAQYH